MRIPFPYQDMCIAWLATSRVALLAADMGLGKTGMAIRGLDEIGARRVLVICPAVAVTNWVREFGLWQLVPRTVAGVYSSKDRPKTDVIIVNYDKLSRGSVADLLEQDWDAVIFDEGHALKTPTSKRVKVAYGNLYGARQGGIVSRAKRVWVLTATPVPNNAGELWTHLRALAPERLPRGPTDRPLNYHQFVERYCMVNDTPFGQKIVGNKKSMLPEMRELLRGFMLRIRKTDVLHDLPPLRFATVLIEAREINPDLQRLESHPEVRELVATLQAAQAKAELTEAKGRIGLDEADRLTQLMDNRPGHVTTLRRLTGLVKVAPALELLTDELSSGALDKVVIFAVHRETIDQLTKGLASFGAVQLHGGTSSSARQAAIDGFQTDPKIRVFVGQVAAAGTAITLTAADNVVFVESSWVPADNAQAASRCHRIGTTKPVLARFLALAGSVDELVQEALARKTRAITEIVEHT